MEEERNVEYKAAFKGRFSGVLWWPQFDDLWQVMKDQPQGWYVYEPEVGGPPDAPMADDEMQEFLAISESYIKDRGMTDCCGSVYTDSFENPGFIKIFNPQLMGGCSMGKTPLPNWILSRIPPVSLEDDEPKKEGLFGRLVS